MSNFPTQQQILTAILSAIGTVPHLQSTIGAKDFLKSHNWLEFSFPRCSVGDRVRITYGFDLKYQIDFYYQNGDHAESSKSFKGLRGNQLASVFERATGFVLLV